MRVSGRVLVLALAATSLAAQVRVEVAMPSQLGEHVAAALRAEFGPEVSVVAVEPGFVRGEPGTVVFADAFVLKRLSRERTLAVLPEAAAVRRSSDGTFVLPWSLVYGVFGVSRDSEPDWTWERLALSGELDQRLVMLSAERDPGPWLGSMQEALRSRGGLEAAFGFWTTIDARLARYVDTYAEAVAVLDPGSSEAMAAVLPLPLAVLTSPSHAVRSLPSPVPIGMAVVAGGDVGAATALVLRTCSTAARTAVRERAGLADPAANDAEPTAEMVGSALLHFEQRIRGQGRGVERVADVLDYVFLVLLGVVLCGFWIRSRKEDPS